MKKFLAPLVAAASLLCCACLPVTTANPVGSTSGLKPDPALYGTWRGSDSDNNAIYLHFLGGTKGAMIAIWVEPPHDKSGGSASTYELSTATLNSHHFINARGIEENGAPVDKKQANILFPLLYRITANGMLALSLLDEKEAAAAITAGKIKGVIDPGKNGDVHITAGPAALDAFFASNRGLALFGKPFIVLHKLN